MEFDQSRIEQKQKSLAVKLCQLPCFHLLKVANISVIDSGLSQPSFHVKYENKAYFAKYLDANSIEPLASQLAATHGISPKLIYVGYNWLITEFIAGEGLDTSIQSEDEKLAVMLTLLARCHSIGDLSQNKPQHLNSDIDHQNLSSVISRSVHQMSKLPFIPNLDIPSTVNLLLQNIVLNASQEQALKSLLNILQNNLANTSKIVAISQPVFCHGDANFSNVIQLENNTKSSIDLYKLIDFECACLASIEYDLAMLMAVNDIDSGKIEIIKSLYQQAFISINQYEKPLKIVDNLVSKAQDIVEISTSLVTCYLDLSLIINALWYISKYQSRKQSKYKKLAEKQLRLLADKHQQANIVLDEMR
ncbi:aminoglycoside phosphotransferase family protein [Colwellia sp. BRX10-3]|uniref:aminoglycoside phosphotransferase family protein n=1 Tax=Colwellia sp. BRX10-3 TaxID=2759844 RepID=UPI0015F5970B|nr:aminoglycoside phosphotransferase family protein [Colwellia sp. BRX10-3]MBA6391251.1 aminoglycoside phosphotransferase family protein [Colwellia sp. BRX10-3]